MKIVYHHSAKWISNSPSITFITYTAIGFAKAGYDIHLIVWNNSDRSSEDILRNTFDQIDIPPKLTIHRIDSKNKREYYKKSFKLIKELSPKVAISRALTFLPYLLKLKNKGIKVSFEMHDLFTELSKRNDLKRRKKLKHFYTEIKYFPKLDSIICLQKAQEEKIKSYYSINTIVAPTGLIEVNNTVIINDRKYWAYIGSFDEHKGVLDFLNAIKEIPEIPVKLIGGKDQKDIDKLKDKISKLQIQNEVVITGWLGKKELKEALNDVKFGIIPLKDTYFNRYLTSPLKLFDYLANIIPPIVSDLDSIQNLVLSNKTGFISDWSKESLLSINSISNNDYSKMCNEIKQFCNELTWEKRAEKIMMTE